MKTSCGGGVTPAPKLKFTSPANGSSSMARGSRTSPSVRKVMSPSARYIRFRSSSEIVFRPSRRETGASSR